METNWQDNVSPDHFGIAKVSAKHEREMWLRSQAQPKEEIDEIHYKKFKCVWCKEEIDEQFRFFCDFHKETFCDHCVKNYYKPEIEWKDAPHCSRNRIDKHDCIYKRIPNEEISE